MSEYRHSEFVPLATLDSDSRPELCLLSAQQMAILKIRSAVAQSCEVTVTRVEERAGVRFIATAPDHEAVIARLQEALHVTDVARLVALQDLDNVIAEVERLQARVRELEASVPSLPDIHTVTAAARCWAKHHDAPDHRIDAACERLIETLRPRLTSISRAGGRA